MFFCLNASEPLQQTVSRPSFLNLCGQHAAQVVPTSCYYLFTCFGSTSFSELKRCLTSVLISKGVFSDEEQGKHFCYISDLSKQFINVSMNYPAQLFHFFLTRHTTECKPQCFDIGSNARIQPDDFIKRIRQVYPGKYFWLHDILVFGNSIAGHGCYLSVGVLKTKLVVHIYNSTSLFGINNIGRFFFWRNAFGYSY